MFGFLSNSNSLEFSVLSHAALHAGHEFWEMDTGYLTVSLGLEGQSPNGEGFPVSSFTPHGYL